MSIDNAIIPTNDLIEQVLAITETPQLQEFEGPVITPPRDTVVDLPGGYVSATGEFTREAEVRELTGRDEEVISKANSLHKVLQAVLTRGVVRIGESTQITESMINGLLAGDRDYLLTHIYAATFGSEIELTQYCPKCEAPVDLKIDVLTNAPVVRLENPSDRRFTVACSIGDVTVDLPTGYTQKELFTAGDKTLAELSTILLANTVIQVNGRPVIGRNTVLDLPIKDRRAINDALVEHAMGPQLGDCKADCPLCETTLEVPLSTANLFQF